MHRRLGLAVAALALVAVPGTVTALECRGMTPLPEDLRIVPPAAHVPEAMVQLAGAWTGAWRDARGNDAQCNILVVEEVHANDFARAVYSVGAYVAPLSASELAAEIPGHTFTIGRQRLFFAAGGRLFGSLGTDEGDLGAWEIRDGRVCRTWTTWDHGRARCYSIFREADGYAFDDPGRFARFLARRSPGGLTP